MSVSVSLFFSLLFIAFTLLPKSGSIESLLRNWLLDLRLNSIQFVSYSRGYSILNPVTNGKKEILST